MVDTKDTKDNDDEKEAKRAAKAEKLGDLAAAEAIREEGREMDRGSVLSRAGRGAQQALALLREHYPPVSGQTLDPQEPATDIQISIMQLAEVVERLKRAGADLK